MVQREDSKEKAFEDLFRQTYHRLYYYALDWVEREDVARDVVSDLFSDLWARPDLLVQADDPMAYLSRAVRNRCLNYLQRQATERRALQAYLEERQALVADDANTQQELIDRVQAVMNALPPRTRYVVEQCYLEGRKYSELATLMDTTAGMVHKHISRALATFRKALGVGSLRNNLASGNTIRNTSAAGSIVPSRDSLNKEHEP